MSREDAKSYRLSRCAPNVDSPEGGLYPFSSGTTLSLAEGASDLAYAFWRNERMDVDGGANDLAYAFWRNDRMDGRQEQQAAAERR